MREKEGKRERGRKRRKKEKIGILGQRRKNFQSMAILIYERDA